MFEDFLKRFDEIETLRVMTDDWERTYAQTGDIAGALNGHLTAQAYIWYKDGSWMKCTLKKGVLEGPFEWRSKDHRSSMSGEYANGKREGHWDIVSKVSDTVTRSEKCQYKEGHIIGDRPQRIYLEKNRLPIAEFTLSAAGKKTGEFKQYNNDGSLYKKCHYSDGMLDGEYTTYSHGRVRTQGAFSYGARNGE